MALDKGAVQTAGLDKGAVQSEADQDIISSIEEDSDLIFHGLITEGISGSIFENSNILNNGATSIFSLLGSLFDDSDVFGDGLVTFLQEISPVRLYLNDNIVIDGVFIDLANKITLAEQGASAESTNHLGITIDEDSV